MAPSMQASSFLISFQRSDCRVVSGGMFSPRAFSPFPFGGLGEFSAALLASLTGQGSFDSREVRARSG